MDEGHQVGTFLAGLGAIVFIAPFVWWLLCGVIAAVIAGDKGRSGMGFFFLGLFFLGPFAIGVAILASPIERPKAAVHPAVALPAIQPKHVAPPPKTAPPETASVMKPKPPPGVMTAGASVKVVAAGDDHAGQVGIVYALLDDDGDGLTVSVKFKGDREPYAFRRDELKLES